MWLSNLKREERQQTLTLTWLLVIDSETTLLVVLESLFLSWIVKWSEVKLVSFTSIWIRIRHPKFSHFHFEENEYERWTTYRLYMWRTEWLYKYRYTYEYNKYSNSRYSRLTVVYTTYHYYIATTTTTTTTRYSTSAPLHQYCISTSTSTTTTSTILYVKTRPKHYLVVL